MPHVHLEVPSVTAKGALQFPGLHNDFSIVDNTRADARARLRVVRCGSKRVRRDPMLTWKSHRSPLREHFSFQANMATFLFWTIQRADARASARLYAAAVNGRVETPC